MTEENANRQEKLKGIIKALHDGNSVEKVRTDFKKLIKNVSPEEIAEMEQGLIREGLPVEDIQRLCDVHVQVFEKAIKGGGPEGKSRGSKLPGHPVKTFLDENREVRKIIGRMKSLIRKYRKNTDPTPNELSVQWERFREIEKHYARKENQLFPLLERGGFTGPSRVMWGKHNEIRELVKEFDNCLRENRLQDLPTQSRKLFPAIARMIFMEEKILFPTALKKLTDQDWAEIRRGEKDIGYAWIKPGNLWDADLVRTMPTSAPSSTPTPSSSTATGLALNEGRLTAEQIDLMLKNIPLDISFVDENDKVAYYSATEERVFPRSPAVIGREIRLCHPQKSVKKVEEILESFRKKEKDTAEFWIDMKGRFIHIRYFALYAADGRYSGTLEVTQDATAIRALEGEKRLL